MRPDTSGWSRPKPPTAAPAPSPQRPAQPYAAARPAAPPIRPRLSNAHRLRPSAHAAAEDLTERARAAGVPALIVALDGVTDPRNLGAVARSVAAFGGHGVLLPARPSARVIAGAWKASAGALAGHGGPP